MTLHPFKDKRFTLGFTPINFIAIITDYDLSVKELAVFFEVTPRTIHRWKSGENTMSYHQWKAFITHYPYKPPLDLSAQDEADEADEANHCPDDQYQSLFQPHLPSSFPVD